jgi:hypothetical protein
MLRVHEPMSFGQRIRNCRVVGVEGRGFEFTTIGVPSIS